MLEVMAPNRHTVISPWVKPAGSRTRVFHKVTTVDQLPRDVSACRPCGSLIIFASLLTAALKSVAEEGTHTSRGGRLRHSGGGPLLRQGAASERARGDSSLPPPLKKVEAFRGSHYSTSAMTGKAGGGRTFRQGRSTYQGQASRQEDATQPGDVT